LVIVAVLPLLPTLTQLATLLTLTLLVLLLVPVLWHDCRRWTPLSDDTYRTLAAAAAAWW